MPEDTNKMTMDKLKILIADAVQSVILDGEFVPFKKLKDEVHADLENLVKKEDLKTFEAELEKLRNLPGPAGAANIDPADNALKGLHKTGGYDSFSAFAKDVYLADLTGAEPSPRFTKWLTDIRETNKILKTVGATSLEVGDPEQGGYLTPAEFANKTLVKGFENSNFINRCTKIPMKINQVGIPFIKDFDHTTYVHGNMRAYWLDELDAKTPSKPKFGKVTLRLNKLAVLVYASDEILEDSVISLEPLLKDGAADAIGWKVDEAIIRGTGAGQPLGVIGGPSTVPQAKETGQLAGTVRYQNVLEMYSRLYPKCFKKAVWVANLNAFPQLASMAIPVGTGGSAAYLPANGLSGLPYNTLMGKEIIWTEQASSVGTTGDLMLADFSQYLIGQKSGAGIKFAKSIHLKFDYDQTAFRFVMRLDGQPWWPSLFTQKRGDTLGPFVTLNTRA